MFETLELKTVHGLIHLAEALDAAHDLTPKDISDSELLRRLFAQQETWAKIIISLKAGIQSIIDAMTRPEKAELLALMWSGREKEPSFKEYMKNAYEQVDSGSASYITEKGSLADYLREGLKQLNLPMR